MRRPGSQESNPHTETTEEEKSGVYRFGVLRRLIGKASSGVTTADVCVFRHRHFGPGLEPRLRPRREMPRYPVAGRAGMSAQPRTASGSGVGSSRYITPAQGQGH